ncbi:hypothetical protein LTR64_005257 [Lithohypha guttulata]|uniref:uncharacterized protein n=1 Tax=Lithohypha guttulata TaxID=1690604 RepID=UPI002DE12D31|nr:hypothetical protein LTR51_002951 [Lithohypha guttulata]
MSLIVSNGTAEGTILYQYNPSDTAGYAFVALFSITTIIHIVLMLWYRSWYFIPMILGGIMEAGGYYGRAWNHDNPKQIKAYVLYLLLTLSAPPFIAATIYMALTRIMTTLRAAHLSIFNVRFLTTTFVVIDIICFLAFLGGAGMQIAASASLQSAGRKVVLAGLGFQIICFLFFVYIAIRFHKRNLRGPGPLAEVQGVKWRKHSWALYLACLFMLVRNIFRIAEYTQGHEGVIARHEWFIYTFDATMMWLVMVVYATVHPGRLVRQVRKAEKQGEMIDGQELDGVEKEQDAGRQQWS